MSSLIPAPKLELTDLASANPLAAANKLSAFYRQLEGGYHAGLRAFLQHAYGLVAAFSNDKTKFDKLRRAKFWNASRQKPNAKNIAKWTLYYIMQATSAQVRSRAGKYAKILNFLRAKNTRPCDVARLIDELGGIENILCRINGRVQSKKLGASAVIADVDELDGDTPRAGSLPCGPDQDNIEHDGSWRDHRLDRQELQATRRGPGVAPVNSPEDWSPSSTGFFINTTPDEMRSILAASDRIRAPFRATIEVVVHPRQAEGSIHVVSQTINISEDLQPWLLEPDDLQIEDLDLLSDLDEQSDLTIIPAGTGAAGCRPASTPMVLLKKARAPILPTHTRPSKIVRKIIPVRSRPMRLGERQ
jgi:hypothetical protein